MQPPDAKLPHQVRAVVFDMDGLIFNTEDIYRDAVMAAAAETHHDVPLPFYLSTVGLSGAATRLAFIERFGESFDYKTFWTAASNRFAEMVRSQLRLKAGVTELLDLLDRINLPRAICTSSRHEDVHNNLAFGGLVGRFQFIIAQGDYAGGKPHPAPFLKAAERLGRCSGIVRGAGGFLSRRPICGGRRNDDDHGARPVSADRRHEGIVRGHRPGPS
jgi:beta-phosphoglucomutase-like phosphatase (HAD superfamily)